MTIYCVDISLGDRFLGEENGVCSILKTFSVIKQDILDKGCCGSVIAFGCKASEKKEEESLIWYPTYPTNTDNTRVILPVLPSLPSDGAEALDHLDHSMRGADVDVDLGQLFLREDLIRKSTFSFGHCPN